MKTGVKSNRYIVGNKCIDSKRSYKIYDTLKGENVGWAEGYNTAQKKCDRMNGKV